MNDICFSHARATVLQAQPVGPVRTRLHLDRAVAPATGGDLLRFACWLAIGLPAIVLHLAAALVLGPLLWLAGLARCAPTR